MPIKKLVGKFPMLGLPALPPEYRDEFIRQARFVNVQRARIFALIVAALQLPLCYLDIRNRQKGLWDGAPGYRALFVMHGTIALFFAAYYLATFIRKPGTPEDTRAWHGFLAILFASIGTLLPAGVSIVDQAIHGQITVYAIAVFWVTAALSLGHASSFLVYFLACATLLAGINLVQHDLHVLRGHVINAPLLTFLAWLLSRVIYAARIREFAAGKIIKRQKDALERDKCRLHEAVEKATASLRESEEVFRTLADTTAASIFIHQGGKFVYVNSACVANSGYTREELLAMNFWDLVHPEQRDMVRDSGIGRLQGKTPPHRYELKIITRSGEERWAYMNAGIIEYRGIPSIIGTAFDITVLKQAEEEKARLYGENVRQYQARIEEERRHAAEKEALLKDLHDGIGGITTNINLLAELTQKTASPPEVKRALETIAELSRESLFEIRGFIQSLDSREMSWNMVVAELRHLGSTMIEPHGITFSLTTEIGDPEGRSPGGIVCLNLFRIYKEALSNIIKHAKAKTVTVTFRTDRERLRLTMRDDGIGLVPGRGEGKGLVSMTSRARAIGGSLAVSSGAGVCVTLDLPFPDPAKTSPAGRS